MSPKLAGLIALGIIVGVIAVVVLGFRWLERRSGIKKADYERMQRELQAANLALISIEDAADKFSEIDSVLAGQIKETIRNHRRTRQELTK